MTRKLPEVIAAEIRAIPEIATGLVTLELSKHAEGIEIDAIWSEVERGKGHARNALQALFEIADRHGVDIHAQPHRLLYDTESYPDGLFTDEQIDRMDSLNEEALTNEELLAWYQRLGFETTGEFALDDPVIVRRANSPMPAP